MVRCMSDAEKTEETTLARLSRAFAKVMGKAETDPSAEGDTATPADDSGLPSADAQTDDFSDQPAGINANDERSAAVDACPVTPATIIESIMFVGHPENEPIRPESIARLLRGVEVDEVVEQIAALNAEYADMGAPITIAAHEDGYRMELLEEFEHVRDRFYGRVREARLSQQAIDVLAVVAYNQPVTLESVDKLIDNPHINTSRLLNQLVRRDLLSKRLTDETPRRREYVTTDRFLSLFNLTKIEDLPRSEDPE